MDYETTKISSCICQSEVYEDDNSTQESPIYRCNKCHCVCNVTEVCVHCLGTGEMTVDEAVYAGEPHMAPIGSQKCICQLSDPDDYDDQERE